MAYGDDIDALGNAHRYILSANADDSVGTNNGTNSGGLFTGSQICEDTSNSYVTASITDGISLPTIATINSAAQDRKAVCGWFTPTAIQNPPKNIYGEGDATQAFRFVLGWGNYLVFEVDSSSFTLQVFGDVALTVDRPYHLCAVFEGSGYGNEFRAYLDGVEQLNAEPTNRQPGATTLTARSVGEFGAPAGTVAVGGTAVILIAPINGQYSQWAFFDGASAVLTDTEVREELFEKGALPDNTISSGTESAMQTSIDAEADTAGTNVPLDIRIEAVTGDGDLALTLDNRTFDALSSIHIQYMGTGTLTIINTNGADASIGSTPNGGTIIFSTEVTVSVTCKDATTGLPIENARVQLLDSGDNTILGNLTNASGVLSGTYNYVTDDVISSSSRVRMGGTPFYKSSLLSGTITINGLDITVLMVGDS